MPAVHGVVRWRACDLIMRLYEEFGLSVSDDTIYRALKNLGFSHVSARPQAYKQDPEVMRAFKKTSPTAGENPWGARCGHGDRGLVPGRDPCWPEEQAHLLLGQDGLASAYRSRSTDPIHLPVRCGMPSTRRRRRPRAAGLQHRSHAAPSRRDRHQGRSWRPRHSPPGSSRLAWCRSAQGSKQYLPLAAAAALTRTQSPRKHLAVHASELAFQPHLQRLRRHRRSLLLRLEHPCRSALENHVHRPPRLGAHRSLIVRVAYQPMHEPRIAPFAVR